MAEKIVEKAFSVPPINLKRVTVVIKAKSPLICHQFSEKSKKEIQDIQAGGKVRSKERPPKTPEVIKAEYESSVYADSQERIGFPAINIKNGMVRAGKNAGFAMTDLKTLFWVYGEDSGLIPLKVNGKYLNAGKMEGCRMRTDWVRVGNGGTDIRYRAEIKDWEMEFVIEYDENAITPESVLNLLQRAGQGGLGEWRPTAPKNGGDYGMFEIKG